MENSLLPSTQKLSLQSLSGKFDVPDLVIVCSDDGPPDRTCEVAQSIDRFQVNGNKAFSINLPGKIEPRALKVLTQDPTDEDWLVIV